MNSSRLRQAELWGAHTPFRAAIDAGRLAKIEIHATNTLSAPVATWPKLTNQLILSTNGIARLTNTVTAGQFRRYFIAVEPP
jgi:hypothetical protein